MLFLIPRTLIKKQAGREKIMVGKERKKRWKAGKKRIAALES